MRISRWLKMNTHSLGGKTVAISGATGGLGRELCSYLASLGATLILLDRNMKKSEALASDLRAAYPELSISHIKTDMEDISSVRSAAEELYRIGVDYLLLNAGAYSIPRHKTSVGYDNVFQINFLSPYYLARRLLPSIQLRGGKVIAVGSIAHNYSESDQNDIDFSTREAASKVYGNAKRYLMYSLFGLEEYRAHISVAHPGITFTNITAHYPKLIFAVIKYPMKLIFMKPRRAALSILWGIFEDSRGCEWIGPRYFDVWGIPRKKRLNTATREEMERICRVAEGIYAEIEK